MQLARVFLRAALVLAAILGCLIASPARGGPDTPDFCDAKAVDEAQHTDLQARLRYQPRTSSQNGPADRCEGAIAANQSKGAIELVGLWTACVAAPAAKLPEKLRIGWAIPPGPRIILHVSAGRPAYLLHAASTGSEFSWPSSEVVAKLTGLSREGLSALAWIRDGNETVRVPVYWSDTPKEACKRSYVLRLKNPKGNEAQVVLTPRSTGKPLPVLQIAAPCDADFCSVPLAWSAFTAGPGRYQLDLNLRDRPQLRIVMEHHE